MKIYIRKIKLYLIGFLLFVAIVLLMAQKATPVSPFTFQVKRLQEKVFMRIKSTPESKFRYYQYLLVQRLNDLSVIVDVGEASLILSSSLRYSTTAGQMTELILASDLKSDIPITLSLFQKHQQVISKLIESYPKGFDNEWKYLQDDYNYLTIYSQMLQQD